MKKLFFGGFGISLRMILIWTLPITYPSLFTYIERRPWRVCSRAVGYCWKQCTGIHHCLLSQAVVMEASLLPILKLYTQGKKRNENINQHFINFPFVFVLRNSGRMRTPRKVWACFFVTLFLISESERWRRREGESGMERRSIMEGCWWGLRKGLRRLIRRLSWNGRGKWRMNTK